MTLFVIITAIVAVYIVFRLLWAFVGFFWGPAPRHPGDTIACYQEPDMSLFNEIMRNNPGEFPPLMKPL